MKYYTSIEQSKKLLKLGLNPESADFEYKCIGFTMHTTRPTDGFKYQITLKEQNIPHEPKYNIPCWSLGALLEVMPHIIKDNDYTNEITLLLYPMQDKWFCVYNELDKDGYSPYAEEKGTTPIEAAYFMAIYLLENGYIKRNQKLLMNN